MPNTAWLGAAKLPESVTLASVMLSNVAKSPKFALPPLTKPTPYAVKALLKLVDPVPPWFSGTVPVTSPKGTD